MARKFPDRISMPKALSGFTEPAMWARWPVLLLGCKKDDSGRVPRLEHIVPLKGLPKPRTKKRRIYFCWDGE